MQIFFFFFPVDDFGLFLLETGAKIHELKKPHLEIAVLQL